MPLVYSSPTLRYSNSKPEKANQVTGQRANRLTDELDVPLRLCGDLNCMANHVLLTSDSCLLTS